MLGLVNSKARGTPAGFTVVELVTVIGLVGILAAVVLPRFVNPQSYRDLLLKDQLISVARFAQQSALSRYGERVCLQVSLSGDSWLFEVWSGIDDSTLPPTQCATTTRLKRQTQARANSTLLHGSSPVGSTPVSLRYDSLGNLVGLAANQDFTASGRNVCVTLAGYAYSADDRSSCLAN
ncbi:type II secretion system protein [Motiliproteus sediminis]|uniref:type II secretion system protein n=1 Tax=Motiliproteus sediminis TaxID=1468178 RepID=UPI001AEFA7D9|nr:type II secretion system protein [Motiliproteus sediminis]